MKSLIVTGAALLALASNATAASTDLSNLFPHRPGSEGIAPASSPAVPWSAPSSANVPLAIETPSAELTAAAQRPLSLPELIDLALRNNPATRRAWLETLASEAALGSTRSSLFPEVDGTVSLARSRNANSGNDATTLTPALSVGYLLFDFGGRSAQIEQARQTLIAAGFFHNAAIQDTVLRVEQLYYQLLDQRALLSAQTATLEEFRTNLEAAEARHNAGVATIADVLQARTQLSQGELNREQLEGSVATFEGALATMIGVRPDTKLEVGALPADLRIGEVTTSVDALLQRAVTQRPELGAARAQVARADSRIRAVRSAGMPSVSVNANAGRAFDLGNGNGSGTSWSTSLLLRVPIFTGWRNYFDLREAQFDADIAREQVRATGQQVALDVWSSYHSLTTSAQRVATSRDLLASAQQSYDVARGRYRAGVGTILDLLTAQAALANARSQEIQARSDWLLSLAQLAHDVGTLGPGGAAATDLTKGSE